MFLHNAQDHITVGAFSEPLDAWLLDEPAYQLPDGALWRLYDPGAKHFIGYGLFQRDGELPWIEGDVYLAKEAVYSAAHPTQIPDVPGFEAALVVAFGGDFLAINTLYSGWPLFKDMLESGQWTVADLLLSDSLAKGGITDALYLAIIAAARTYYIPLATLIRLDTVALSLHEGLPAISIAVSDTLVAGLVEATAVATPLTPIQGTDTLAIGSSDAVTITSTIVEGGELMPIGLNDPTPTVTPL